MTTATLSFNRMDYSSLLQLESGNHEAPPIDDLGIPDRYGVVASGDIGNGNSPGFWPPSLCVKLAPKAISMLP